MRSDKIATIVGWLLGIVILGSVAAIGLGAFYAIKHIPVHHEEPLSRFGE